MNLARLMSQVTKAPHMRLSSEVFQTIQTRHEARQFPAGYTIIEEGQPGDLMYIIVEGKLVATLRTKELAIMSTGEIFGEMGLVSDIPRGGTVTALSDCLLIPLTKEQLYSLLNNIDQLGAQIIEIMAQRLQFWLDEEVQHQRLEHELAIGSKIQESLLPVAPPNIPGWQIADFYRAARQVGGDFFDYIDLPSQPGNLGIVIGDVSGKGVPAALFMAVARTMLRAESRNCQSSAETLTRTNSLIHSDSRSPLFLSALHATLNPYSGKLSFSSAGHELPLIFQHNNGVKKDLASSGLVLGALNGITYQEQEVFLVEGDIIIFYTDGITEARNESGQFFGEEGLQATLVKTHDQSAAQIRDAIVRSVTQFHHSQPQDDDQTLIVIKRTVKQIA